MLSLAGPSAEVAHGAMPLCGPHLCLRLPSCRYKATVRIALRIGRLCRPHAAIAQQACGPGSIIVAGPLHVELKLFAEFELAFDAVSSARPRVQVRAEEEPTKGVVPGLAQVLFLIMVTSPRSLQIQDVLKEDTD